eukprot:scaffold187_cov266-Chaetoceros_neogracile.AAC.19
MGIENETTRAGIPVYLAILHIAVRIAFANKAPITDCDEVFNYWEPLHFIQYGYGMQTWEYASQYALRTYAYLLPFSIIAKGIDFLLKLLPFDVLTILSKAFSPTGTAIVIGEGRKVLLFHLLRAFIAFGTSISEIRLVNALPFTLAIPTWMALLTSAGMYHTAPAYLPSTTVMLFFMHSIAEQLNYHTKYVSASASNKSNTHAHTQKNTTTNSKMKTNTKESLDRAIVWGLLCCLVTGWPFCAVLFVPLGFHAIHDAYHDRDTNNKGIWAIMKLLLRVVGYCIVIQAFVTVVDYFFYAKVISPTWNIFVYNTGWGGDGINRDQLYGVEDCMYYIKNLILNWNGVAILGACAMPILLSRKIYAIVSGAKLKPEKEEWKSYSLGNMIVILLPACLWIGIVFSRPHKEERFLFPIYPLIAIGASTCLDQVMELTGIHIYAGKMLKIDAARVKIGLALMVLLPCSLISISRSMLLTDGYTAPLKLYSDLYRISSSQGFDNEHISKDGAPSLICTGGEWYRFPSSYHLPENASLAFLKSSFDGQLPQPFTQFGSKQESLALQGVFNDLNEENVARYVGISDCAFTIEIVGEGDEDVSEVMKYMIEDEHDWKLVAQHDFLDADKTSSLHRILYLPMIRKAAYKKYSLFQRV